MTKIIISSTLILSSTNAFDSDQSKILLFVTELTLFWTFPNQNHPRTQNHISVKKKQNLSERVVNIGGKGENAG